MTRTLEKILTFLVLSGALLFVTSCLVFAAEAPGVAVPSVAAPAAAGQEAPAPAAMQPAKEAVPAVPQGKTTELLLFDDLATVITSSKKSESADKAPNVMYVITKEQIRNRGYKNLEDILNFIPGFSVWYENQSHAVQARGIGTADNEGLLILINGHNIRGPFEPDPLGGEVMLDNVERVEVIVGPGSVLYGSDSLYGVVNIITEKINGTELGTKWGNDGYRENYVNLGTKQDETTYANCNISYLQRDGFDPKYDSQLNGTKILGDVLPSYNITAKAGYKGLDVQYFHHNYMFLDTQTYYTQNGNVGQTREYLDSIDIRKKSEFTDELAGLLVLTYDNKRHIRRVTGLSNPLAPGDFTFDLQELSYQAEYDLQYKTEKNFFQVGVQGGVATHDNNYWGIIAPSPAEDYNPITGSYTDKSYWWQDIIPGSTYSVGMYLSDEFKLTENLSLTGAIRADKNTILAENFYPGDYNKFYFSPRLAVGYQVTDNDRIKVMYNRATRFPGAQMSQHNLAWGAGKPWVEAATNFANINTNVLQPALLDAYEFQNIWYAFNSRIAINVFYQKMEHLITWAGPHSNIGTYTGHGAELSIMTKLAEKMTLTYGGEYSSNKLDYTVPITPTFSASQVLSNLETGDLVGVPKFIMNLMLDYNITDDLSVCPSVRYFTGQTMNYKINPADPDNWTTADNMLIVNLGIRQKNVLKIFDIGLSIQNLLNNDRPESAQANWTVYRERPTSVILDVSAKF